MLLESEKENEYLEIKIEDYIQKDKRIYLLFKLCYKLLKE